MTINQALNNTLKKLRRNNIPTPHFDTEILLSYVLKKAREYILSHPEKHLTKKQAVKYQTLINRRIKNEPIAYITGCKQFYGLNFIVNKHVLVPRPETELMVEEAICISRNKKHLTFVDVGTGSGCIVITLAELLKLKAQYLATEISKLALNTAHKNARIHKVDKKITFLRGNLLEPVITKLKTLEIKNYNLVILANLPYLTPAQIKNSRSIQYEPKISLSAGPDGLKYYRQLFKQVKKITIKNTTILCEIDPSQVNIIKRIIKNKLPKSKIQIKKDLAGLNRLVIVIL